MSKRFFKTLLSSLLALMMMVTCAAIPSSAATVALSRTSVSLTKGYATTLKVTGTSNKAKWSTGNKSIATVSSSGKVVGKSIGSTYIYAKVSGKILKCKVTVVAGKITVSNSDVQLGEGDKTTVTVRALGTHVISAASTDKSVVKATWNGAKFNGNNIKLTLTAIGSGTARVKVYAKNYSKTIYKYIDVTVGDGELSDDDSNSDTPSAGIGDVVIMSSLQSVEVAAGETKSFNVYASELNSIGVLSSNSTIATASVTNSATKYIPVKVTGVANGSTTIKIYAKNNTKNYITIPVTVSNSNVQYYNIVDAYPAKILSNDSVVEIQTTTSKKYMLVPYGYDPAYVNSLAAAYARQSQYYTVYTDVPSRLSTSDKINTIITSFNGRSVTRYMLVPNNYDQARIDTAIATYEGQYAYYVVYTVSPTKLVFSDEIVSWQKITTENGKQVKNSRYMLVPYGMSDSQKVTDIKNNDMGSGSASNTYYTVYNTMPARISVNDIICSWLDYSSVGKTNFMLLQSGKDPSVIMSDNDKLYSNDKQRYYFTLYSTAPSMVDSKTEAVIGFSFQYSDGKTGIGYMLVDKTNASASNLINIGLQGVYNNAYPQKTLPST